MKKSKQIKKKEKNFAWSFVIVCFLLAGAVLLNMVSSKHRELIIKDTKNISDWQTYTNTKYGFEFKYPNTFLLEEATENNYGTIVNLKFFDREAQNFEGENIPGYFSYMTVSYWDDINNEYAKGGSWMGQRHYSSLGDMLADDKAFIKKQAEIELAGIKVYEVIVGGYSATYGIMFERNNGVYRIDFPDEIQHKPDLSVREGIISTFKFLDSQDLTNDWQTYANTKYGFEFQYPKDWEVQQESDGSIYLTSNLPWPQEGKVFIIRETEKSLAKFIDDYNKSDMLADGTSLSTIFEQKDYSIAGVRADLLKGSTAIGVTSSMIFLTHKNRSYVIDFNDQSNSHLQVLKSFKFME